MKIFNLSLIIFISLIINSYTYLFTIERAVTRHCFRKNITINGDKVSLSFSIIADPKILIDVDIKQRENNQRIYYGSSVDQGKFTSPSLKPGIYELCFYPHGSRKMHISFTYTSLYEDQNNQIFSKLASDYQMKTVFEDVNEIKQAYETIISNSRILADSRYSHLNLLNNIIGSIKRLTYLKLFIILILSVFQIYVIRKLFGNEKRVSVLKFGDNKSKENIL